MPRQARIVSNDGIYHVLNRGNYRSFIFESEGAKLSFEKTLFEACEKFSWNLSAYCVMSNHFHLCLATPRGNLSEGMRWLQATYAMRFNRYRKVNGHLFQGRFKSLIVEPGKHWQDLVDYIHLNPVRAGLVDSAALGKYPWTSLYRFPKRKRRPKFLDCSWMDFDEILEDSKGGWMRYLNRLTMKASDDPSGIETLEKRMCRGWCLGGKDFKIAIVKDLISNGEAVTLEKEELGDFNRTQWELMLEGCMNALGKTKEDILRDDKSAAWKKAIASKMRRRSSVTGSWLSDKLQMGAARNVNAMISYYDKGAIKRCPFAKRLRKNWVAEGDKD